MRRLLLLICVLPISLWGETIYQRIYSVEEITENGEYIIGAMSRAVSELDVHYFYVLNQSGSAAKYIPEIPHQIDGDNALHLKFIPYGDKFVLQSGKGYLKAPKSGSTMAYASPEYTIWDISEEDGEFIISSGDHALHLSTGWSSTKFAFLSRNSIEATVCIYKHTHAPESITSYTRFLADSDWETLCLPFSCAVPQGIKAKRFASYNNGELTYTATTTLEAGIPYIISGHAGTLFQVQSNGQSAPHPLTMVATGTFTPLHITEGYVLNGKEFVPSSADTFIPAYRAYIKK